MLTLSAGEVVQRTVVTACMEAPIHWSCRMVSDWAAHCCPRISRSTLHHTPPTTELRRLVRNRPSPCIKTSRIRAAGACLWRPRSPARPLADVSAVLLRWCCLSTFWSFHLATARRWSEGWRRWEFLLNGVLRSAWARRSIARCCSAIRSIMLRIDTLKCWSDHCEHTAVTRMWDAARTAGRVAQAVYWVCERREPLKNLGPVSSRNLFWRIPNGLSWTPIDVY